MFSFPKTRLRRKRLGNWIRNLSSEHELSPNDLILPLFVHDKEKTFSPVANLEDIKCYSINDLILMIKKSRDLGINAVAIFPVVEEHLKSNDGEESYNLNNLVCRAIHSVKSSVPEIGIIADVALDPYTVHGHDGILRGDHIENDETISVLCKQALALSESGCDIVAPSDMMDGRIGKIREALDSGGFHNVSILSYAAKYCSNFYAPFRKIIGSSPSFIINKSSYQMDCRNAQEAICEIAMDINEGADFIMIKPGMPYLDVIKMANDKFDFPIFAYQVSGEYAMIKAAATYNWLDYDKIIYESLIGFKRAGASAIITYAAIDVVQAILRNNNK